MLDQAVDGPGAHGAALRFKFDDQFAFLITQFAPALQSGGDHGPAVFIPVGVSSFQQAVEFAFEVVGAQRDVGGDLFDAAAEFFIAGLAGVFPLGKGVAPGFGLADLGVEGAEFGSGGAAFQCLEFLEQDGLFGGALVGLALVGVAVFGEFFGACLALLLQGFGQFGVGGVGVVMAGVHGFIGAATGFAGGALVVLDEGVEAELLDEVFEDVFLTSPTRKEQGGYLRSGSRNRSGSGRVSWFAAVQALLWWGRGEVGDDGDLVALVVAEDADFPVGEGGCLAAFSRGCAGGLGRGRS